jgi:thiamine monophosphate synthase
LKKVRAAIGDFPLVAIGGINSRISQQFSISGANSAAIISGLLSARRNQPKFRGLLNRFSFLL